MWFSILVRRLLARASWTSVTHLREGILAFIAYYNRLSNGPFHWTYKGPRLPRYFREAVLVTHLRLHSLKLTAGRNSVPPSTSMTARRTVGHTLDYHNQARRPRSNPARLSAARASSYTKSATSSMLRVGPARVSNVSKLLSVKRISTVLSSDSPGVREFRTANRSAITRTPRRLHSSLVRITCSKSGSRAARARSRRITSRSTFQK